jgi:hypothetical protein
MHRESARTAQVSSGFRRGKFRIQEIEKRREERRGEKELRICCRPVL